MVWMVDQLFFLWLTHFWIIFLFNIDDLFSPDKIKYRLEGEEKK